MQRKDGRRSRQFIVTLRLALSLRSGNFVAEILQTQLATRRPCRRSYAGSLPVTGWNRRCLARRVTAPGGHLRLPVLGTCLLAFL